MLGTVARNEWRLDVSEFLAVSQDQEVDGPTLIGISDNGGLRPSVGPQGRDGHDPLVIQNLDCGLQMDLTELVRAASTELSSKEAGRSITSSSAVSSEPPLQAAPRSRSCLGCASM